MQITHLNPPELHANPAFSQAVVATQVSTILSIGGQDGVTSDGKVVEGGIGPQTKQALENLLAVLKASGATQENVIKMNVYVVKNNDMRAVFAAAQAVWGAHPTAMTVVIVDELANPAFLIEVDALAVK